MFNLSTQTLIIFDFLPMQAIFSSFGVKLRKKIFFFLLSKDLDKVTVLEMSYGLNLSFRSPESIGEYSEKNLAP